MESSRRLQQKLNECQAQYELLSERIQLLKKDYIVESDTSIKFKLQNQINQAETDRDSIEQNMVDIENELKLVTVAPTEIEKLHRELNEYTEVETTEIQQRNTLTTTPNKAIKGITEFHPTRKRQLGELLEQAKEEIILYAVQHQTLVEGYQDTLKKKAKKGCNIKILIMATKNDDGTINPNVAETESHRNYKNLLQAIEYNTKELQELLGELDENIRDRIRIRTYTPCPTTTYTFIDREAPTGFVQVEILLYGMGKGEMPYYIVTKTDDEKFLQRHYDSFLKLWNKGKDKEEDNRDLDLRPLEK